MSEITDGELSGFLMVKLVSFVQLNLKKNLAKWIFYSVFPVYYMMVIKTFKKSTVLIFKDEFDLPLL
jgi:hypothetical protein